MNIIPVNSLYLELAKMNRLQETCLYVKKTVLSIRPTLEIFLFPLTQLHEIESGGSVGQIFFFLFTEGQILNTEL